MNWTGGSRQRIKRNEEEKKQKDFFERQRLNQRLNNSQTAPRSSNKSLDLASIATVNKVNKNPWHISKVDAQSVNLDAPRRLSHVNMSPPNKQGKKAFKHPKDVLNSIIRGSTKEPAWASTVPNIFAKTPAPRSTELETMFGEHSTLSKRQSLSISNQNYKDDSCYKDTLQTSFDSTRKWPYCPNSLSSQSTPATSQLQSERKIPPANIPGPSKHNSQISSPQVTRKINPKANMKFSTCLDISLPTISDKNQLKYSESKPSSEPQTPIHDLPKPQFTFPHNTPLQCQNDVPTIVDKNKADNLHHMKTFWSLGSPTRDNSLSKFLKPPEILTHTPYNICTESLKVISPKKYLINPPKQTEHNSDIIHQEDQLDVSNLNAGVQVMKSISIPEDNILTNSSPHFTQSLQTIESSYIDKRIQQSWENRKAVQTQLLELMKPADKSMDNLKLSSHPFELPKIVVKNQSRKAKDSRSRSVSNLKNSPPKISVGTGSSNIISVSSGNINQIRHCSAQTSTSQLDPPQIRHCSAQTAQLDPPQIKHCSTQTSSSEQDPPQININPLSKVTTNSLYALFDHSYTKQSMYFSMMSRAIQQLNLVASNTQDVQTDTADIGPAQFMPSYTMTQIGDISYQSEDASIQHVTVESEQITRYNGSPTRNFSENHDKSPTQRQDVEIKSTDLSNENITESNSATQQKAESIIWPDEAMFFEKLLLQPLDSSDTDNIFSPRLSISSLEDCTPHINSEEMVMKIPPLPTKPSSQKPFIPVFDVHKPKKAELIPPESLKPFIPKFASQKRIQSEQTTNFRAESNGTALKYDTLNLLSYEDSILKEIDDLSEVEGQLTPALKIIETTETTDPIPPLTETMYPIPPLTFDRIKTTEVTDPITPLRFDRMLKTKVSPFLLRTPVQSKGEPLKSKSLPVSSSKIDGTDDDVSKEAYNESCALDFEMISKPISDLPPTPPTKTPTYTSPTAQPMIPTYTSPSPQLMTPTNQQSNSFQTPMPKIVSQLKNTPRRKRSLSMDVDQCIKKKIKFLSQSECKRKQTPYKINPSSCDVEKQKRWRVKVIKEDETRDEVTENLEETKNESESVILKESETDTGTVQMDCEMEEDNDLQLRQTTSTRSSQDVICDVMKVPQVPTSDFVHTPQKEDENLSPKDEHIPSTQKMSTLELTSPIQTSMITSTDWGMSSPAIHSIDTMQVTQIETPDIASGSTPQNISPLTCSSILHDSQQSTLHGTITQFLQEQTQDYSQCSLDFELSGESPVKAEVDKVDVTHRPLFIVEE